MADDDHVGEAKEDIQAVKDIFGAGPADPPAPPAPPAPTAPPAAPITPPPLDTTDIDSEIGWWTARRDSASRESARLSEQARTTTDPGAAADLNEQARSLQNESLHYQEKLNKAQEQKKQQQELAKQGCSPALIAIAAILGLVAVLAGFVVKNKLDDNDSSKTSAGAAASSCSESGERGDHLVLIDCATPDAPLDGHWVLVDGLNQPGFDMGVACDTRCQSGRQMTVDKADVTMDISGDKITGGNFKTGYSSTMGDQCTRFDSHIDATVSGGADQVNKYGQLIVDGTQTNTTSCDSNRQPVTTNTSFHTSRFYFLSDPDTLTLCYNIDPTTFNACTTTGFSTPPPSGVAATFKRG